jgi:hypothetical protein
VSGNRTSTFEAAVCVSIPAAFTTVEIVFAFVGAVFEKAERVGVCPRALSLGRRHVSSQRRRVENDGAAFHFVAGGSRLAGATFNMVGRGFGFDGAVSHFNNAMFAESSAVYPGVVPRTYERCLDSAKTTARTFASDARC